MSEMNFLTHQFRRTVTGKPFLAFLFSVVFCCLFISCKDINEPNGSDPDLLEGSIYEVLEDEGKYSIFLKGVELANMKPMLNGKNILTVMAPTDSAFTAYLQENHGGKKIEELSVDEIAKLIGFHILYYSFTKDDLINFRPVEGDGASEEQKNLNAGLYYKFRTKSQDAITLETDTAGNQISVYHLERFLPVFSHRMFQTKQIDAKYNYEYFFHDTPWKGGNTGFNISNAAVNEYAQVADNGYIYKIDRVLRPLETIYDELASNGEYSDFLNLYNAYQYYQVDPLLTREYGNGTDLYQHYHSGVLPHIDLEWPVSDYRAVDLLAWAAYSVFAPNNSALRSFFDDYWRIGGYESLEEVSPTSVEYLLFNCVYGGSIVFPEEIKKGLIENYFETIIKFDVDAVPVGNRKVCVNGVLYGCDVLTPPAMFGSVTGPAFQHKKYSYFLNMINVSTLDKVLASDETRYFMLYPSNDLMNRTGITMRDDNALYKADQLLNSGAQQTYVYAHVVSLDGATGSYQELPSSGTHVFRTLSPNMNLYWFVKDGKITNCIKHNELLYNPLLTEESVYSELTELTFRDGWTNGKCYSYDNNIPYMLEGSNANMPSPNFIPMMINNRNTTNTIYHGFIKLLEMADLVVEQSITPVVESCLMFVPVTDAVRAGILAGKIPGITSTAAAGDADFFDRCTVTDIEALKNYVLQYFIPLTSASISNFPYVGWNEATGDGLPTLQSHFEDIGDGKVEVKTTKINVRDASQKLSIQVLDSEGNLKTDWIDVIDTYHYFPFVFDDGCIHFIKEVI